MSGTSDKRGLYEILLTARCSGQVQALPDAEALQQVWPRGRVLSDLLPFPLLCKPLSCNALGEVAEEDYPWLKAVKKAEFMTEAALCAVREGNLLELLKNQSLYMKNNTIFSQTDLHTDLPLREILGKDPRHPFALEVQKDGKFHIFTDSDRVPDTGLLTVGPLEFTVDGAKKLPAGPGDWVCQRKIPVTEDTRVAEDSASVFRLGYDASRKQQYFCRGSVFDRADQVRGSGVPVDLQRKGG